MRRFTLSLLSAAWLVAAAATPCLAQAWWNDAWQYRRTVEVEPMAYQRPGGEAALVEFTTGGHIQPDGADIRVVGTAKKKLVPHQVVFVGPGDRVSVIFKHIRGMRRYYVYYGNPKCKAEKSDWEPQRGLMLETRPYRGGGCANWKEMEQTLKQAGPPFGRAPTSTIFHGHNPYGPSANFVSIYKGWLNVPREGEWEFAISSAAASFLFLDDKPLVSWPGWHGAASRAYHRAKRKLKKGLHRVAYYHVQRNAVPYMVTTWRRAGSGKFSIISPAAFLPPLRVSLLEYRMRGANFAVDFDWRNAGEAVVGDRWFPVLKFSERSYPRSGKNARRTWDFGDGVPSQEPDPSHAYLARGTHTVTLTIWRSGKKFTCSQKVVVDRAWRKQTQVKALHLKSFASKYKIADYPFKSMTPRAVFGALLVFRELDQQDVILKVGLALPAKLKELPPADACEATVIVAKALRDTAKDPVKAIQALRAGEAVITQPELRGRLAVMIGDTIFYHQNDPSNAKAEYDRVVRDYAAAKEYVRLSLMRLGDIARERGQLDEARSHYKRCLKVRGDRPPGRETLDMAMRSLETEEFLRRGDLEAAKESLHLWQWQQPEEKLRGQWSVLKVKYSLAKEDVPEAIKQAEILLRVNPESQYAPKALLLLAEAHRKRGEEELARAALQRLKKDYPDSPLVKVADEELQKKPKKRSRKGMKNAK